MAFVSDLRLVSLLSAAALYILSCIGLWRLAESLFGQQVAIISVALFAWSPIGLFYAASLWQRAHPVFYIWMAYFALCWVKEREGRYLGYVLLIYAVGLYVFMELAPAIFLLIPLWLFYRPPIRVKPVLIAAALSVLLWSPYLVFEGGRGFIDLISQIGHVNLLPDNARSLWCNPNYPLVQPASTDSPFEFLLTLILLLLSIFAMYRQRRSPAAWVLAIPTLFLILASLSEFEPTRRYWWLFPIQMMFIAAWLYSSKAGRRWLVALFISVLILPYGLTTTFEAQLSFIAAHGYGGSDPQIVQNVELLGETLQAQAVHQASIGYVIPALEFEADYHAVDPEYKVGMEYDTILKLRYGVENTSTCPEGISSGDQFTLTGS